MQFGSSARSDESMETEIMKKVRNEVGAGAGKADWGAMIDDCDCGVLVCYEKREVS